MNGASQDAGFKIEPEDIREDDAEEGLEIRVGWAEPEQRVLSDRGY